MPAVGAPGTSGAGSDTSVGNNSGGHKHLPGEKDPLDKAVGPTSAGAKKRAKPRKRGKKDVHGKPTVK